MHKSLLSMAVLSALSLSALSLPTLSFAADAAPAAATPDWTFPSSIGFVSDYIWRGQTQTWGKPAVQAGIEADHVSGFYAGIWGSNVSSHWLPNANLETDFSVGFRNAFATDFRYDVGGTYIYYPGGDFAKAPGTYPKSKINSAELYASLGWKWFTVKGGYMPTKFYGWTVDNSPVGSGFPDAGAGVTGSTNGAYYYMGSASYDVVPGFNLAAEVGRQTIPSSTGLDWTWYKVGATKSFDGGWAVNAFYTGTSGSSAYTNYFSFDNPTKDFKTIDQSKLVIGLSKSF
jgi:uncharacterized protein (TIGR02001 family)